MLGCTGLIWVAHWSNTSKSTCSLQRRLRNYLSEAFLTLCLLFTSCFLLDSSFLVFLWSCRVVISVFTAYLCSRLLLLVAMGGSELNPVSASFLFFELACGRSFLGIGVFGKPKKWKKWVGLTFFKWGQTCCGLAHPEWGGWIWGSGIIGLHQLVINLKKL